MTTPEAKTRHLQFLPYSPLVPLPEQVERHLGTPEHASLTDSIRLHGIIQALSVLPRTDGRYDVISGNGRALAAIELKLQRVPVLILSPEDTDTAVLTLVENLMRMDLKPVQTLDGIVAILKSRPEWLSKDIAAQIGKSESFVSQNLAVHNDPEARDLMANANWSLNESAAFARATPEGRVAMRNVKAANGSSHAVIAAAKPKTEEPEKPAKPPKRVAMPLKKLNASVSVTGDIASVDGLIAVLTEALELARKSLREQHSLTTACRAWADKAKAGA